ncbi:YadA C-terminal domain-containing protein [Morganella morganii]|uniref:YadA C-terminal domain-containing protein n=1 Tax=Morganella morganii TaxID=582 RepID=UPI0032D9B43B
MKKSILALIISPLFIHAANANMKPFTEVTPHGLGSGTLFEFAEEKTEGDRAVGVSEIEQITRGLGQFILENYEYVDDVRKEVSKNAKEQDKWVGNLNRRVEDINHEVLTFKARADLLETKTQEVERENKAYTDTKMSDIERTVSLNRHILFEDRYKAESAKVVTQALLGATEDLETDVDKLKNKVLAVELQARFAKQSAYTSEKDIREHKNQLSAQSRDIAQNKKLLESAKLVTSAITDATLALEADVAKMDTRISNASKKAGTALNVANQNTKSIDGQKVKVEKNTLDILKNRQDLRSLEKDLRETNERLDNGLAASAALNGLFQPYGVGKLNITAAVGGYQSTQAVAVGTGYRFNENIAVKTGMAYTGSNDVMYNMAFNLEW